MRVFSPHARVPFLVPAGALAFAGLIAVPPLAQAHGTPHHARPVHAKRSASPSVKWVAPHAGQVLNTFSAAHCRLQVRSRTGLRAVVIKLDGHTLRHTRQFRCIVSRTAAAAARKPGTHRLTAVVVDRRRHVAKASVTFKVRPPHGQRRASRPPAPSGGRGAAKPAWSADFSSGNFNQWTWFGQGQSNLWGHISVVKPASVGVPAPPTGAKNIAQMTVTGDDAAAGRIHAKVYEGFSSTDGSGTKHPPADVSGTYTEWYYLPRDFAIQPGTWSNIFQFKEEYNGHSDPLWWVQLGDTGWANSYGGARWIGPHPSRSTAPVAFLSYWGNPFKRQMVYEALPLGRWFQIRADVHQGDRIDFSIDGKPFDTGHASEYPVSPFHPGSQEWTFGTGNYSTSPNSTLYLSTATYSH